MVNKEYIVVVAGILEYEDKICLARRSDNGSFIGHWEFPGGKLELGEMPIDGLRREIKEELGIDIETPSFYCESSYDSSERGIRILFYHAMVGHQAITSTAHDKVLWLNRGEFAEILKEKESYPIIPPDIPVISKLIEEVNT